MYTQALKKALTEIKNLSPDIQYSFLLSRDGAMVAEDDKIDRLVAERMVHSFKSVLEKATAIDGLESYLIEGENGKTCFSQTGDMYIAMTTSKSADIASLQSTPRLIIPTILKLFESVVPSPTAELSVPRRPNSPVDNRPNNLVYSKPNSPVDTKPNKLAESRPCELIVETFSSNEFYSRFSGENVQVDRGLLDEWNSALNGKIVGGIQIETQNGKKAVYKVRAINDSLDRNGTIRIPVKACRTLGIKPGQTVNVKPVTSSTATQSLTFLLKTS
jgi:predicted regulator of Ras-like GTPase activity (Roadblock/LC7/MglB family)